ncbi:hypothetical protein [Rossellomorea marisflavi]|uniref:hypothetical protein n=1 Tax=Rossellomorea marisflavi TaxID=189381 RepID=UPI00069DDC72|nr:hypothetical protein [Rossellomorea marisflavi]
MLRDVPESHFYVLKGPFESGRQSPAALTPSMIVSVFISWLLYFLTYTLMGGSSAFPAIELVKEAHFYITILLSILCLIASVPSFYKKYQKAQYAISIFAIQFLFGICLYLISMMFIGTQQGVTEGNMKTLLLLTIGVGVLLLAVTVIRFFRLLKNGEYKYGSAKWKSRMNLELKSNVPLAIVIGVSIVLILQYIIRNFNADSLEFYIIALMPLALFYMMLFILPEQLVLLYCKKRFTSFNFEADGKTLKRDTAKGEAQFIPNVPTTILEKKVSPHEKKNSWFQ